MAARSNSVGIDHLTVVPSNFEPSEDDEHDLSGDTTADTENS